MSFHLNNTLGAMYIGMIIATSLHGISVVQTLYYYTHQHDRWPIKSLVIAVMVCDTVHQALISQCVYEYAITAWGDPKQLGIVAQSLLVEVLFNGITAFLVQSFLALRVWRLSQGNKLLTTIIVLFVLAEFISSIVYIALGLKIDTFAELVKELKPLSLTVNALAAAGDLLIAGALCVLLHLSRTGFQKSDTMINKLILFTVNTGLLTSLCAVASFVSYIAFQNTFIYIAFYFCIGRLYTNALLATLNARKMFRNSPDHIVSDKVTLSLRELSNTKGSQRQRGGANIDIKINTTKELVSDIGHDHDSDMVDSEYFQTSDGPIPDSRLEGKTNVV